MKNSNQLKCLISAMQVMQNLLTTFLLELVIDGSIVLSSQRDEATQGSPRNVVVARLKGAIFFKTH